MVIVLPSDIVTATTLCVTESLKHIYENTVIGNEAYMCNYTSKFY